MRSWTKLEQRDLRAVGLAYLWGWNIAAPPIMQWDGPTTGHIKRSASSLTSPARRCLRH